MRSQRHAANVGAPLLMMALLLSLLAVSTFTTARAATATPTSTPTPGGVSLKVQYKVNDTSATDNQIKPGIQVINTGTSSVALSDITLRYWYTSDGSQGQSYSCDYAVVGCANVTGTFGMPSSPTTTADRSVQIGFKSASGSLAPGKSSGEIQSRLNKTDWSSYNEANDYSYGGAQTSFADWSKVTVYYQGTLVWGTEPKSTSTPTNTPTPTDMPTPTNTPSPTPTDVPIPANLPDLTVISIAIAPQRDGCPSAPLGLEVQVANIGTADAGSFVVQANYRWDKLLTVPGLAAGQSIQLWFPFYNATASNNVQVNVTGTVLEGGGNNNWRSEVLAVPDQGPCLPTTPTVTPTPISSLPDLQVRGSGISADVSCPPGPVYVRVVVYNAGNTGAGPFVVQVNSETQTVAGLAPRESIGLKFIAVMSEYSPTNIYADPANQVAESDESNNFSRYEPRYPTRVYCPPTPTGTPTPTLTPTLTPVTPTVPGNLPDLTITSMWIGAQTSGCSQGRLGLWVQVANIGTADAGPFSVGANGATQTVAGLAAGQSLSVWLASNIYGNTYSAGVALANQAPESNTENNVRVELLPIPTPLPCTTATPTGTPTPTEAPTYTPTHTLTPTNTPTPTPWETVVIEGHVRVGSDVGPGLSGVQISVFYNEPSRQVQTNANGYYRIELRSPPYQEATSLTPSAPGYTFSPTSYNWIITRGPGVYTRDFVAMPTTPSPTDTPISTPGTSMLKVQYRAANTNMTDNQIRPHVTIVNIGASAVPLSELTLRYWYTIDGDKAQSFACDYAVVGCANVKGSFVKLGVPRTGADNYLELSFSGTGTIPAGGQTGEIQTRLNKADWTNYSESDDYSFDPTKTAFADWTKVTLYRNGVLVWGSEP